MKIKLTIAAAGLLFLLLSASLSSASSSWLSKMYAVYTIDSFNEYEPARQRIIIKRIDTALLQAAIFYATNQQRCLHKLPEFKHSQALEKAANTHSRDMVRLDFFSHQSPLRARRTLKERLRQVGITNAGMAENIAITSVLDRDPKRPLYTPEQNGGYFSYAWRGEPLRNHTYLSLAEALVQQWMNSKGHRRNILNPSYVYLGCGAAHFKDATFHNIDNIKATQNFSTRDKE